MITPTKVEPTTGDAHIAGTASGVWSAQDQLEARRGGAWPDANVANPDTLIEKNFSIDVYNGSSGLTITNGINLAGKGGMVWGKSRNLTESNWIVDSNRGTGSNNNFKYVRSDSSAISQNIANRSISTFNSNGFTFQGADDQFNSDGNKYCTWTFKKASKFFDVVTYTGTGSARTIAHSLGSTVGMMLIKNTANASDAGRNWAVYHRGADGSAPEDKYLILNNTDAVADSADWWNDTAPTTSVFTVGTNNTVNADGENYVAYLFAHETGSDSMIQCGNYTHPNDTSTVSVNLGWEPQWILFKADQASTNWYIFDTMRGIITDSNSDNLSGSNDVALFPNTTGAENANTWGVDVTATGFNSTGNNIGSGGNTVLYVAIRRPDMETITDATKVFAIGTRGAVATEDRADGFFAGFPIDLAIDKVMNSNPNHFVTWRKGHLDLLARADNNSVFPTGETEEAFDSNTHFNTSSSVSTNHFGYMFKRAKGFCDVQMYRGTGSAKTEAHRLQVAPELMIIKSGTSERDWAVYYGDNTDYLILNTTAATDDNVNWWNDTSPTSSVFTVGTANETNESGKLYLALLFATLAGVSKVGSVTHSGSSTDVDCGFSAGARFVLIKRTDATGNWYIFDTTNGIVDGNDPHWTLDLRGTSTTDADLIDPLAAGFTLTGDFTDGDYIFLAIA